MTAEHGRDRWLLTPRGLVAVVNALALGRVGAAIDLWVPYLDDPILKLRVTRDRLHLRVRFAAARAYDSSRSRSPFPSDEVPSYAQLRDQVMGAGALALRDAAALDEQLLAASTWDPMAGDRPRYWVLDTNLLQYQFVSWLERWLGQYNRSVRNAPLTVGWCIPSGVRDEVQTGWQNLKRGQISSWSQALCSRDRSLVRSHFFNQPSLRTRYQRIGHGEYFRALRHAYIEHPSCARGDESIIAALVARQRAESRRYVVFSNDSGMIERCHGCGLCAIHVQRPRSIPEYLEPDFETFARLLWTLAIVYGVIRLGSLTIGGVWLGKRVAHWERRQVVVCSTRGSVRSWLAECERTLRGSVFADAVVGVGE